MADDPPARQPAAARAVAPRVVAPKAAGAFRTIGEVSQELGVPQHVLRYWEGRFPQVKPVQRAGNRRHYRPEDIALLRRIDTLLNSEGYTIRGVRKLLEGGTAAASAPPVPAPAPTPPPGAAVAPVRSDALVMELRAIRSILTEALAADDAAAAP